MVSSPLLDWEAGRETKVRERKMLGTYSRIFIIRNTHHFLYYTIASFYCQEVNSFLSFLVWFSLRLCFQPCNPVKAELNQPLCSRTEDPAFMIFILPSLAHPLFRQRVQPGESTTYTKPWELTRGITANCVKTVFFKKILSSQVFCFMTKYSPRLAQEKYFLLLLFFSST